ncbi:MAG TPA: dienelactone hydrolase family protein [Stellaceae bacterium]|nr:dienelactone hydrolase family protein [Stellaceae bacterium]
MGKMIELTASDGHKFGAYRADPAGKPKGALVVIQEIFGVNHHMKHVTDDFAAKGYVAICPALFDRTKRNVELGYDQAAIAEGREIRGKVGDEGPLKDVQASIDAVKSVGKVGTVGYCWGGYLTFLSATRLNGISAAVGYYGGGIANVASEKPKVPTMLHFGDKDQSIPMSDVEKVQATRKDTTIYIYSAGHGFSCDERGSFDAGASKTALDRTLAFFAQHVG